MSKGSNKIYNNYDEQFMIMQSEIEANKQEMKSKKQDSDEKMMKLVEYLKAMLAATIDHINTLKSSPTQKDPQKSPDPTTMVPANRRDPPLDGGQYTKIGGMWNFKHDIISPKFYEILIKT